ncbi:MAG: ABC transporter ATP-binding protein [Geminicoccaceae bacterium]
MLNVRWPYFTRHPVGRLANSVSLDSTRAGDAYLVATTYTATVFQAGITLVVALLVSWKVALVRLLVGALIALVLLPLVKMAKRAGNKQRQRTEDIVTLLSDTLSNIKPLKAMSRQAQFAEFFSRRTGKLRNALQQEAMSRHLMKSLREPIVAMAVAGAFYFVHTSGVVALPELLVMGVLLSRIISTLGKVQELEQRAQNLQASYWSVHGLVAEAEAESEQFTGTRQPTFNEGCSLDRVTFGYGEKPVLKNASLTIPAGQLTVITGPSGVGKTTITDLLLGLLTPQSGTVRVDGVPLDELDVRAWRSMLGYVPQELALFHDSVLANVTLGDPAFDAAAAEEALRLAGAWDFVAALPNGIEQVVGERGTMLSGGQRQRIALARALVVKPKLLILDEVTSALDPETEAAICANVRQLSGRVSIVAITHRPIWVELADRLYEVGPTGITTKETARAVA